MNKTVDFKKVGLIAGLVAQAGWILMYALLKLGVGAKIPGIVDFIITFAVVGGGLIGYILVGHKAFGYLKSFIKGAFKIGVFIGLIPLNFMVAFFMGGMAFVISFMAVMYLPGLFAIVGYLKSRE